MLIMWEPPRCTIAADPCLLLSPCRVWCECSLRLRRTVFSYKTTEHSDKNRTKQKRVKLLLFVEGILAEVTEVVWKIQVACCSFKAPGVDNKPSETLNISALCWLTHLYDIAWRFGTLPMRSWTRVVVHIFKIQVCATEKCALRRFTLGCWTGSTG